MPTTNPVPSQDPSDLLFNAGKLDEVLNGTGNSFTDRLGVARRTVAGMNSDFDAQLADAESDLNVYRADAAASAAQALGYLNTIQTTSYGAYASDPATDPLGNPPTIGDEYFNTTANLLKRFNGTTWQASDINTANLAAPSGSSLVGYQPAGTGAVATTVQSKLRESVSVKDFGADPSKTAAENAAAFALAAAHVSSIGGALIFPAGEYAYSGGLEFTSPVSLVGFNAKLNYTGAGYAVKLGPDGLTVSNYQKELYEVTGLEFTGGANMTHGIYINEFVVYSSIHNNKFTNFGNASAFMVFAQAHNWFVSFVDNNVVCNTGSTAKNVLRTRGKGVTSGTDYGQSKLYSAGNNITNITAGTGIGIWASGVASTIVYNKMEGFKPNVRIAVTASSCDVSHNYYENAIGSTTGSIEFGDPADGDQPLGYVVGLQVSNSYCNTHNDNPSFSSTSKLIGPASTTAGLQDSFVYNNTLGKMAWGTEVVKLNNLGSQLRNVADNNRCYTGGSPISFQTHTTGASITNWVGIKLDNPIESNVWRDSIVQHVFQGGKTAHQYVQLLFKSYNGAEMGVLQGFNGQDMNLNATNDFTLTAGNRVSVGSSGKSMGFYGSFGQTKPIVSGSRGGNAALGSLVAALANLGLITDSTTA